MNWANTNHHLRKFPVGPIMRRVVGNVTAGVSVSSAIAKPDVITKVNQYER